MARHGAAWPGLVLLLYAVLLHHGVAGKAHEMYRYETAYACEGKVLKIECKEGELIKLIRANYGRFSITICNDHGNTEWSVNCMSPQTLRVLRGRCSEHQNCSIPASTSMFGDHCQGTLKYLEAHYQCLPAKFIAATTTTTNRPSPPWLITSQPPMWSTVKTSARPPPPPPKVTGGTPPPAARTTIATTASLHTAHAATSSVKPAPVHPPPSSASAAASGEDEEEFDVADVGETNFSDDAPPVKFNSDATTLPLTTSQPRKDADSSMAHAPSSSSSSSANAPLAGGDSDADNCRPVMMRSIYWNWTRAGEEIRIQPCPGGTTGFAKWRCSRTTTAATAAQWTPATPDLSECRSVWLTSLEQRVNLGKDPLISITSDLAQVTSSKTLTLYGGDMMITAKIIQKMAQKMAMDIQTFPDTRQRETIVGELLGDVVRTGSNLLDPSQHPSWRDLSRKEQMRVATSLLIGLEENAFLLAETVTREKTVDQVASNINTKSVGTERFPHYNTQWTSSNDTIELPQGALLENSDGRLVRLVFFAFDHLEEILQWHPEVAADAAGRNHSRVLNSKVISASLGKGRHIQLKEPVRLTLRHLQTDNVTNPSCVFWDYTTSAWSEEGCRVEATNHTHTTCLCNHLTNFAILMDVRAVYLPPGHQLALQIITYVGCSISIVCLLLAVVTFLLFRGLKCDRTTIHCNLCVCLLVAEVLFLAGIGRTEHQIACGLIAAALQYFFLCAFLWMFFEGFHLYVMLIEVFEIEKSRLKWYYLIAYGVPALIVGIAGAIFPQGYGTERYCWLRSDNYFIYTFVGPVSIVLLLNFIFLMMAIVKMCRHANPTVAMKNKEHSRLASTRTWLKGAMVLAFLLGLTWTFGFLYLNLETVVMAYIFAILNSLQGFFIFVFHCVQNEKVRKEYPRFIRKHSWLPKCLRCSKPNAASGSSSGGGGGGTGSGGGGGSSGTGKEGRTSLYPGSNGNPSAPMDNSVLSQHGTSLQRDWKAQSLTNMNRVGKCSLPATATCATMAATLNRRGGGGGSSGCTPAATVDQPPNNNTSTLPYIRNFYKQSAVVNANHLPKSASTWGPLHKPLNWKNISFKSYSRDSGHGGSEQEDSPRSHALLDGRANNCKDNRRQQQQQQQQYVSEYNHAMCVNGQTNTLVADYGLGGRRHTDSLPHPKNLPLGLRKKNNGNTLRANAPWNHTYNDIHDGGGGRMLQAHQLQQQQQRMGMPEDDPVYEEIDRSEIQVSDMSDEDGKRQSDMSRQSSRSYGDHRPLIPYSPANEHSMLAGLDPHMEIYQGRRNMYRGDTARSLAAVLDGNTVVCHLEPPDTYPHAHDPYNARTFALPYSDS